MGIFDTNSQHPLEHLYDVCKEVCKDVIPKALSCGVSCNTMETYVINALKRKNAYHNVFYSKNGYYKICEVTIIPNFDLIDENSVFSACHIYFHYNDDPYMCSNGEKVFYRCYLTDFEININGTINEHI